MKGGPGSCTVQRERMAHTGNRCLSITALPTSNQPCGPPKRGSRKSVLPCREGFSNRRGCRPAGNIEGLTAEMRMASLANRYTALHGQRRERPMYPAGGNAAPR